MEELNHAPAGDCHIFTEYAIWVISAIICQQEGDG